MIRRRVGIGLGDRVVAHQRLRKDEAAGDSEYPSNMNVVLDGIAHRLRSDQADWIEIISRSDPPDCGPLVVMTRQGLRDLISKAKDEGGKAALSGAVTVCEIFGDDSVTADRLREWIAVIEAIAE